MVLMQCLSLNAFTSSIESELTRYIYMQNVCDYFYSPISSVYFDWKWILSDLIAFKGA